MERWDEWEGGIRRAPRFTVEFPLQYRLHGQDEWCTGHGRNISRSGLLFEAGQALAERAPIEVTFFSPVQLPGEPKVSVVCQGRVVRHASMDGPPGGVVLASTIETYRFERQR
jgi:hypothetical protein